MYIVFEPHENLHWLAQSVILQLALQLDCDKSSCPHEAIRKSLRF